ncbi:hypothetical protein CR513_25429, partial [Mucuna pruriens]
MLDLGASINVMPTSIYKSLNFGDLEPTGMTMQLANRSVVQPLGVLEDVLVQVNELIFPTDFYMLDMKDETPGKGSTLILGQPFLMTVRTKIDVHARTLSMEFGDISKFAGGTDIFDCLGFIIDEADCDESWKQLSIIIANNLRREQEEKLLHVLRQHKMAIGWKLTDLPSINPSICMHKILMKEEARPIRQQQRSDKTACCRDYLSHLKQLMG